jgi:uncharacterized protein (TIGR03083 family)
MIPLVEQLAATWRSVDDLCSTLSDDEWRRPTGCPGWTVQDQVSHLVDYEAGALGRPRPDHAPADLSHTKNEMGAANEVGVDARRSKSGAEVLAELREVVAARLDRLASLTEADLEHEASTPVGPGTLRDVLTLRLMDTWSHEQDIRRALDRPGHADGPAVATTVAYWSQFLPILVAKRAGAPDGTVVFAIGDLPPAVVEVAAGRGRLADGPAGEPLARLRMDAPELAAFVGGRSDAPVEAVHIDGDVALGRRILDHLGFLP